MTLEGRRQFLAQVAAGALAAGCGAAQVGPPRYLTMAKKAEEVRSARVDVDALPATQPFDSPMRALLQWLATNQWFDVIGWPELFPGQGPPTDPRDARLFEAIYAPEWAPRCEGGWSPRTRTGKPLHPGFENFAGLRAIHPGRPEFSALYHALASPQVANEHGPSSYPSLEMLDLLENFIFALEKWPERADDYCLVVLAYEYRPAALTPHRAYDDLVFSRTGIARVGREPMNYDARARGFSNEPHEPLPAKHFAVTPARYGLFLARKVDYEAASFAGYDDDKGDRKRYWIAPVRKVYSGDPGLGGSHIRFGEQHQSVGLQRVAKFAGMQVRTAQEALLCAKQSAVNLNSPPFVCRSSTIAGLPVDHEHNADLVDMTPIGSSVLLASRPADLVRPAQQNGPLYFWVAPEDKHNRRYSTVKLLETEDGPFLNSEESDAFVEFRHRKVNANRFNAPRDTPMFINARYQLAKDGEAPIHLAGRGYDAQKLNSGQYWAALFEDSICDGCVAAWLESGPTQAWATKLPAVPAFSIVTAPDFMPNVAGVDLDDERQQTAMQNFAIGNTAPLSFTRLAPNPAIHIPRSCEPAFPKSERAFQETATALVSRGASDDEILTDAVWRLECEPRTRGRSGFLPDTASAFLFPGWDVTYVSDGDANQRFLATTGLGSPFPEDVKLCAAGNGMWPATAPDAARTFQGSLEPAKPEGTLARAAASLSASANLKPPTAVPLLDSELGLHPLSPAVAHHRQDTRRGWDGEYGPFLELVGGGPGAARVYVNYADIRRADYVENARQDLFDASILRGISSSECVRRMKTLRRCIALLDRGKEPRQTALWLVSAERVDWTPSPQRIGTAFPEGFQFADELTHPRAGVQGNGYLFVFVQTAGEAKGFVSAGHEDEVGWARNRIECAKLSVCQIGQSGSVSATSFDPRQARTPLRWV